MTELQLTEALKLQAQLNNVRKKKEELIDMLWLIEKNAAYETFSINCFNEQERVTTSVDVTIASAYLAVNNEHECAEIEERKLLKKLEAI